MKSSNPADAWNYIKRATFTNKGGEDFLPPLQSFNQFFASVVQDSQNTQLIVPSGCNNDDSFHFPHSHPVWFTRHYRRLNLLQHQAMTSFLDLCSNDWQERWHLTLQLFITCLLYTSPSPRDRQKSRMPSSA